MPSRLASHLGATIALLALLAACGSEEPTEPVLTVGGTYVTAVTLGANSCAGVVVLQKNTTVTHSAGASTLTLTHNGLAYSGTVTTAGAFSTTPKAIANGDAPLTISITGSFSVSAINASVMVAQGGANPCQYTVTWIGPRQSGTNVIPG